MAAVHACEGRARRCAGCGREAGSRSWRRAEPGDAAAAPSPSQPSDAHASPAERPSGASAASTTSSQRELLQQTQAANRIIPAEGPVSPVPPDGTCLRGGRPFCGPTTATCRAWSCSWRDIVREGEDDLTVPMGAGSCCASGPQPAMQVMRVLHLRLAMPSGSSARSRCKSPGADDQSDYCAACISYCCGSMQGFSCEQVKSCCNLQDEGQGDEERHLRQLMDLMHQEDSLQR